MASKYDLPKLSIKSRGERNLPIAEDLIISLDGYEVKGLRSLNLSIVDRDVTIASIEFVPGEIDVDAAVLLELEAILEKQSVASSEG